MDERKVLLKAAKLIEERGWAQEDYTGAHGGFCMIGAINTVANGSPMRWGNAQAYRVLHRFLDGDPVAINDREYTDPTQAICALVGAAMMDVDV